MADSHYYHSATFNPEDPELAWQILKEAALYIESTVSLGSNWEVLDYTNKDRFGGFDVNFEIIDVNTDWDPLAEQFNGGDGPDILTNPSLTSSRARSIYVRYSEGAADNHNINVWDYFMSTVEIENSGTPAYSEIKTGALVRPWERIQNYGSSPWVPQFSVTTGWGAPPDDPVPIYQDAENPGFYDGFPPEGSFALPDAKNTLFAPWSYQTQPGFLPNSETTTNFINFGLDLDLVAHYFIGVEGNAPYFYVVLESQQLRNSGTAYHKYYAHFGVGNIIKSGTWKGGQFTAGHWTNSNVTRIDSIGNEYNCRMFDSHSTRYASSRCGLFWSLNMDPYDPDPEAPPENIPERYLFGYTSNGHKKYCFGNALGGLVSQMREDSINTMNGRSVLFPHHIRVLDQDQFLWYYFAGIAPATRSLEIDNINPGSTIVEDGITWMIFPIRSKRFSSDTPDSGFYGYAYRVN